MVGTAVGGSGVETVLPSSLPPPQAVNATRVVKAAMARRLARLAVVARGAHTCPSGTWAPWAAATGATTPSRMTTGFEIMAFPLSS